MENNIITLNMRKKKRGTIDVSLLEAFVQEGEWCVSFLRSLLELVNEAAEKAISEAGLEDLDFKLVNIDRVIDAIINLEQLIPSVELMADDGEYVYVVSISASYDEEDSVSVMLYTSVSRYDEEKIEYEYDTISGEWEKVNNEKKYNITDKQMELICKGDPDDALIINLILDHAHEFGLMSDDKLKGLLDRNQEILKLAADTEAFMDVRFMEGDDTRLTAETCCKDGGRVVFRDGYYILQAYLRGIVIKEVYQTKSLEKMEKLLFSVFDCACRDNVIAVIPLSSSAFAVIRDNGQEDTFTAEGRDTRLSREEVRVLNKCERLIWKELDSE